MTLQCVPVHPIQEASALAIRLAIAIPAYNEGRHLAELIARCRAVSPAMICVVDDCSSDDTAQVLAEQAKLPGAPLLVLRNATNLGKQGSVKRMLSRLQCEDVDAIALIDGDLQHDPAELPALAQLLITHDAVLGARSTAEMPMQRRFANWIVNRTFAALAGINFFDVQSGLRLYRKSVADALAVRLPAGGGFGVEHESLAILAALAQARRTTLRIAAAPISCRYGDETSHIGLLDVLQLARDTVSKALRLRAALASPPALPAPAPRVALPQRSR
jgi:glycosyltransferase involved in cell wall biosynthesis